ncbi:hypothetical protein QZJ86_19715 [Methylomonas montana]|jgi:hypothetical protein|uniref:hypothetical protein n=1 Tax=Methylomonas montana TaxID=3058963 RepID=UPI002658F9DB|nr:hypothetical protein [Methylomonas montana]WKJ90214.1 hypothetical protein QZJ86_19715 [Methylomonas montana]
MSEILENLKNLLNEYGKAIDKDKVTIDVKSTSCIDTNVPASQGVYWIETTMPKEELRKAISEVLNKEKRLRKNPPKGVSLIDQEGDNYYVAYSGTEDDIKKRLKQHLFNQGHADTVKLGCVIDESPFSDYKWRISYQVIDNYEIRYAIEAWWRLNVGWPAFCLR